jgi:hypothetical protein
MKRKQHFIDTDFHELVIYLLDKNASYEVVGEAGIVLYYQLQLKLMLEIQIRRAVLLEIESL